MIDNDNMLDDNAENKVFVYKLMVSQLHHDGYNALALLMEQMLLANKKVQPSDCLTQLLNVCKAVSFADKDLLLEEESIIMSEEEHESPMKSQNAKSPPCSKELYNGTQAPVKTESPPTTPDLTSPHSLKSNYPILNPFNTLSTTPATLKSAVSATGESVQTLVPSTITYSSFNHSAVSTQASITSTTLEPTCASSTFLESTCTSSTCLQSPITSPTFLYSNCGVQKQEDESLSSLAARSVALSQLIANKDVLAQMIPSNPAYLTGSGGESSPILPSPTMVIPNTIPFLPTSSPPTMLPTTSSDGLGSLSSDNLGLPSTVGPIRSLSAPVLPSNMSGSLPGNLHSNLTDNLSGSLPSNMHTNRFNPTVLTHPYNSYNLPIGRGKTLPLFPNLNLKSPDAIKNEDIPMSGVDSGQLLGGTTLHDVVKAFTCGQSNFNLPSTLPTSMWPKNLLSQVQTPSSRHHKMKHCPICNKVLVASSLYLHMKIHTGEKNYICEFCCKRFLLKHHLHSHLKICQSRTLVLNNKKQEEGGQQVTSSGI